MGRLIKKKFTNLNISTSGMELKTLIPKGYNRIDGYIKQIICFQTSGSATELSEIEIRYSSGNPDPTNLIYKNVSATLDSDQYVDSYIDAPFSIDNITDDNQLILYLEADAAGVFDIRIDMEITGS